MYHQNTDHDDRIRTYVCSEVGSHEAVGRRDKSQANKYTYLRTQKTCTVCYEGSPTKRNRVRDFNISKTISRFQLYFKVINIVKISFRFKDYSPCGRFKTCLARFQISGFLNIYGFLVGFLRRCTRFQSRWRPPRYAIANMI